jgi:hypothetical protein
MTEYSRISVREATEHATAAHAACRAAEGRARVLGASRLISLLAGAAQECAAAVEQLAAADKLLQQKAGLLPGASSGATPAK